MRPVSFELLRGLIAATALAVAIHPLQVQGQDERRPAVIDGSPAPVLPASITRDARGRATVRAIRLSEPIVLDGRLEESVYQEYEPFGDFIQVVPVAGNPSSEQTDVWIAFDDDYLFISC